VNVDILRSIVASPTGAAFDVGRGASHSLYNTCSSQKKRQKKKKKKKKKKK